MSQRQATSETLKNMSQPDLDAKLLSAFEENDMDEARHLYNHYANIHTSLGKSVRAAIQHKNDDMLDFIMSKAKELPQYSLQDVLLHSVATEKWDLAEKLITDHQEHWQKERYFFTGQAEKGNVSLLRFCHEQGLNIRGDDDYIVKCAAGNGQLDVLKFLIEEVGADPRARDDAAFGAACSYGCIETAEYIRQKGCKTKSKDNYPVWTAAFSGHLDVLEYLHDMGHSLTKSRSKDDTPLLAAVGRGHTKIVTFLASKGVDLDQNNGQALARAVCDGNLDMVKTLVELDVNIQARDYEWQKENKASLKLKDVFAKWVLRKTENEDKKHYSEYTALACAARGHHADIFDYLLDQGANLHANGGQAIQFAMHDYYELKRKKDPELQQAVHILDKILELDPDVIFDRERISMRSYYMSSVDVQAMMEQYPPSNVNLEQANLLLAEAASDYNWPLAKALIENYDVDINTDDCGLIRQALRDDIVSQDMNKNRSSNKEMLHYLVNAGADTSLIEKQQPKLLFDFNREEIEEAQAERQQKQKEAAEKQEAQAKEQFANHMKGMGSKKIKMKRRR